MRPNNIFGQHTNIRRKQNPTQPKRYHMRFRILSFITALFLTSTIAGQTTIFSENMGTPAGTTTVAANTFQNSGTLTYTASATGADVRNTTVSSGYVGASGAGNVFITNAAGSYFEISGINTLDYTGISMTVGHFKSTTTGNNELAIEVSTDGTTYTALTYSRPTGSGTAAWILVSPTGTIPSTANLRIRFRQTLAATQFRIDDVVLSGTPTAFMTQNNGAWTTGTTWVGNVAPGPNDSAVVRHFVTDATGITRNALTTTRVNAGATLSVSAPYVNNGTTTVDGTFIASSSVTVANTSVFRVTGTLQMNAGGSVLTNAPVYTNTSTLLYNSSGVFNRGLEWSAVGVGTIGTTPGYPNTITLSNNTSLNYNFITTTARALAGNLVTNTGSTLNMNYGGVSSGGALTVGGNFINNGTFSMGTAAGDDLRLVGNFSNSGTFNGNARTVYFTRTSGTQTVSSTVAVSIPYVVFDATGSRTVQLTSANISVTAPNAGNAITFASAADIFDLNNYTLTVGTAAVANTISGAGTFKGTTTSGLTLQGTGSIGTLNFTTAFQNLGTLTLNRTSGAVAATLGTPLSVTTTLALTAGRLDVGNNPITIGSAATITGAGANNFVIADLGNGTSAAMRKVLAAGPVANFVFPVGDRAASADGSQYSPATLVNLSGATYAAGAYVSVAVNDIKHPNLDATTDFISRYWDVQTVGVTSPTTFTVSANYLDVDVNGTEASSRANRWNGTAWANTGAAVGASTNLVTDMAGFVAGGTNHLTAGLRNQEINVIHTASTTNYLHNSTYDFGTVLVGSTLDAQFTVQNLGQVDLALPGTNTIAGGPVYAFAPSGTLATGPLVGPGGTRNFTIRFAPSAAGTFSGSITIPNNDPTGAEAPYVINFTGVGVLPAPEIRVERSDNGNIPNTSAANTGYFTIFAAQDIGTSSAARTFYVRNEGTATLNLSSITSSLADFTVAATMPSALAPAGVIAFTITFTPTAVGTRTATITIANDDADENPFTFGVQGTGQCAASGTFSVMPTSGPANTLVAITSPSFSLIGATASFNGTPATLTVISATQATVVVPVGAASGGITLTNPAGCQAMTAFTIYNTDTTSCEGGNATGELFISEVTDATTGGLSYVEIYNGTASPINMSGYSLYVYSNGSTGTPAPSITALNNYVLNPGAIYLVALGIAATPTSTNTCTITGGNGELANQATGTSGINFNIGENDYIGLYKNSAGAMVDSFGVYGSATWADALGLGDRGATFRRKNNVTVPKVAYTNADWDISDWAGSGQASCSTNDYSDIGVFSFTRSNPPVITLHPTFSPSCKTATFTVTATEGFAGGNPLTYQWYFVPTNYATWAVVPNNATVSGGTTNVLTINNIAGLEGYQFYCQVRENGATCFAASNAVRISGTGTVTWNGTAWTPSVPTAASPAVIDGNYNTSANGSFEACSVTVLGSRTLTIAPNTYVSILHDLTVDAGATLRVLSSGSLVMIEDSGIVTNNGTTEVLRTTQPFVKYDYTYWSSPIAAAVLGTTFTGWRMDYSWIFETSNYSDVTGPNGTGPADGYDDNLDTWLHTTPATIMEPGKGYVIMGPTGLGVYPSTATVTFSGRVNNGIVAIPIDMSANSAVNDDDFNIIGNPYPSSISADDFINLNTNTSGTVKFWTHQAPVSNTAPGPYQSNFVTSDYAMYNLSGGTASGTGSSIPSGMIASGQGFLVEALTDSDVIFNNAMRDKGQINSNFYRQSPNATPAQKDRVWVNFTHSIGLFSQQLVAYVEGATLDYDRGYDGRAAKSGNAVSFYSFIGSEKYRIQGRPSFADTDIVPMGYSTTLPGTYTIAIDHAEGILNESSQAVYIEDKLLNIIHNLKESPYVFTTELGTFNERFQLRYTTEQLGTPEFADDQVGVVSTGQLVQVRSRSDIKSVEIYDLLGRRLFRSDAVNATEFETRLEIAKQALMVKVVLTNGATVTKKIVH